MKLSSGLLYSYCAAAFVVSAAAQDSPKLQLTARELFYSAATSSTPAPAAAAPTVVGPVKKKAPAKAATQAAATKPKPAPTTPAVAPAPAALPNGGRVIPASATVSMAPAPSAGSALGLRCTILKLTGGEMAEVAPDTIFHAGDRIQLSVETNGPGYMYIISQGSSGAWKPMFPTDEVAEGSNHVDGFRPYMMPPKTRLVFDEQAGTEKIFIVFSRSPEPNLENVIYSLQAPKPKPASQPEAAPKSKQLLMASIDDGVVGNLRNTYARDLIIEKVDETTPGEKKEKAIYVVNPTGSDDSHVVADLRLVHQ